MSDGTAIEWTDATVNAVNGCTVLSPGCKHCYAMRLAGTRMKNHPTRVGLTVDTKAGPVWNGDVRLHEPALLQPLRWRKPKRIFWNAHGDLFHDAVPDAWIDRVFAVCAATPQHFHQLLTKRTERMREYLTARKAAKPIMVPIGDGTLVQHPFNSELRPPRYIWLGTSVEDDAHGRERIADLVETPAAVRFLSMEPLLGPVDYLAQYLHALHWVIAGGESGPRARPMHPDWVRTIRDQCAAAGVPFFFKQWGEWVPASVGVATHMIRSDTGHVFPEPRDPANCDHFWSGIAKLGKKAAGRLLDGVEHGAMPEMAHG
ncbi:phage Gp37/Gp68 family protein [Sphingobium sufflavum]|uniref:phage Gp37/Gp68 family protein n=1 Tax=Sphingobium sufflavum TaxID=1129547 RepID=UPI001F3B9237|nr:phage Gp37/Gp68 family protein [Sphingobium sufflavum]MCE7797885.1 phage Gp37/Gp68 family protein [Sphingobium sufflavum]